MNIKIMAHVHYQKYAWQEKGEYRLASFKLDDSAERTYVGEQEIEIEVPDNYDPRAQQIAALEARVMEINERIGKLLALEAA